MGDKMLKYLLNGLLLGSSGYGLYRVSPTENPFAFSACAVGFAHSLVGFWQGKCMCPESSLGQGGNEQGQQQGQQGQQQGQQQAEGEGGGSRVQDVLSSCLDVVIVPLLNIEFYQRSEQSNPLAMGHGLFIVPLVFEICHKLYNTGSEDVSTQALKELTILGNLVSLLFLSANDSNGVYGVIAIEAFAAKYCALMLENLSTGTGEIFCTICYSLLFTMIPIAIEYSAKGAA